MDLMTCQWSPLSSIQCGDSSRCSAVDIEVVCSVRSIFRYSFARKVIAVICCIFLPFSGHANEFIGSTGCVECHQTQYELWKDSHHFHAMEVATADTVLGNFDNTNFTHFDVTSRFLKKNDTFYVQTDNQLGEIQEYRIAYTYGYYPLQQYLIEFPNGRLQALSVSWDSRPIEEGGQRWFHLYPDEAVPHDDVLHWTGAYQNWNSRCSNCHSTNLKKNYSQSNDTYQTSWSELTVGCEACHGPGQNHIEWSKDQTKYEDFGLDVLLKDTGPWGPGKGPTLVRTDDKRPRAEIETCAFCHSRRQVLDEQPLGKLVDDFAHLSLLGQGLYYPDGQIQDEVYVYGSFLQSKMHGSGVVCSNCHEPHGLRLRYPGNVLCLQCHSGEVFDNQTHHHHPVESKSIPNSGSNCVDCHMPETLYMVVDPRRDHRFGSPNPWLTEEIGIPNACNQCHKDKENQWSIDLMKNWGMDSGSKATVGRSFQQARSNNRDAALELRRLALSDELSVITRATALVELSRFPGRASFETLTDALASKQALIRVAAIRGLQWLPVTDRFNVAAHLITDKVRAVRHETASFLAGVNLDLLNSADKKKLNILFSEYEADQSLSADMPSAQMNLGVYFSDRGETKKAIEAYRHALLLSPAYVPALLNLADLYRGLGQDQDSEQLLGRALALAPGDAGVQYATGLKLVRRKELSRAIEHLAKAVNLAPDNTHFVYVYAVALQSQGEIDQAIDLLEKSLVTHPGDNQLLSALVSFYREKKDFANFSRVRKEIQSLSTD
jgi:predicted CXXCH cytochrome family protein